MADLDKSKKREIIKNVAIVFLAVMLVLTFFSNTIMNYSLAEVSTSYVQGGNITTRVTGSGTVKSVDPYSVVTEQSRKIKSVAVRVEDEVEKGDVIYYLEDTESDELKQAKSDLADLISGYEKAVIESGLSAGQISQIESGGSGTLASFMSELDGKDKGVADAKKAYDEAQAKVDEIQKQIDLCKDSSVDTSKEKKKVKEAQKKVDEAEKALSEIVTEYTVKENAYNQAKEIYEKLLEANNGNDLADDDQVKIDYKNAEAAYNEIFAKYTEKETALNSAKSALSKAQDALDNKKAQTSTNSTKENLESQLVVAEFDRDRAKEKYEEITAGKEDVLNEILAKIAIADSYAKITEKRQEVKDIEDADIGGEIVAPVSGTITSLGYVAGETTSPDEEAAVIQIAGKGFTLSYPVTRTQAQKVKVGDEVTIGDGWWYSDIKANLVAIQPDRNSANGDKILEFELQGESLVAGQTLSLSVGQKSSYYDFVVPNNAVKEDANGKFILIINSKNTPFGSRYIAKRCDIQVLESDDMYTAFTADLYGYEYVITTASKPVKSGDQVRLTSEAN